MSIQLIGGRTRAVALALSGIAAATVLTAVLVAAVPAAASGRPQGHSSQAASSVPVVINCAGHAQVRPGQYVLACADGNVFLAGLHWAAWGKTSAFGGGGENINVCVPTCVAGKFDGFPVLVALWHAEALPHHPGVRYFGRMTIIYTGNRTYRAGSKLVHLPQTQTYPLAPSGGA
jgi:hypothetical protein